MEKTAKNKIKSICNQIERESNLNINLTVYQNKENNQFYLKVNVRNPSGLFYYSVSSKKLFIVSHNGGFKMNVAYDSHFTYLEQCYDWKQLKRLERRITKYFDKSIDNIYNSMV